MFKLNVVPSAISYVDKIYRLRSNINARMRKLVKYYQLVLNSDPDYRGILEANLDTLNSYLSELSVSNNAIIIKSDYKAILKHWKQWGNFENHCQMIFGECKPMPKFSLRLVLNTLLAKKSYYESKNLDTSHINGLIQQEEFCCEFLENLIEKMVLGTKEGRKSELLRRLKLEVELRANQNWYFVFNTLTVDNYSMEKVFPTDKSTKLNAWQAYVKRIDHYLAKAAYGSVRNAKDKDYHQYFAVVERGTESGRLHIHVLHMFKTLPEKCVDPNLGATIPYRREIDLFKRFWLYGKSSPVAVRFSAFDAFGRKSWIWPVKCKSCKKKCKCHGNIQYTPIEAKPFGCIVEYIGKYLTKAYGVHEKEVGCIWRTRLSRKMGKTPIQEVLNPMPTKHKILLLKYPKMKIKLGLVRMPRYLLRRLLLASVPGHILRLLYLRSQRCPTLNILKRWQSMIRGTIVSSLQSAGNLRMSKFHEMVVDKYFQEKTYSIALGGPTYAC